jgi:hypothetical protein
MHASALDREPAKTPDHPRGAPQDDAPHAMRKHHLGTGLVARAGVVAATTLAASAVAVDGSAQPMAHDHEHEMAPMEHGQASSPLGIAETRAASGTSWQPDSTPMFMWHWMTGGWTLGLHTSVFAGYDSKSSDRGDDKFISINWVMAMAGHAVGPGDILLRTMLSLEPVTVGKRGYPLLLQTGESLDGVPLHDRQHPHDLVMEIAACYRQAIGTSVGVELYAALAGEPAIGPPAFPHRFTAMADPLAPIGHHWEDSTHISFGVVTAGVFTRQLKLEGSWFNGREPDDNRYDLDLRTPDSFAARLTVNPTADISTQVSWARLASPEELEPGVSVQRTTASVMWNQRSSDRMQDLSLIAVFGRNDPSMGPSTSAGLGEAALMLRSEHTIFTRAELLTKSGHDLVLPAAVDNRTFGMASFSLGYVYDARWFGNVVPGIGFVATVDAIGADLEPFYGTRAPWGGMVFVRLRPPEMAGMGEHAMHGM